MPQRPRPGRAAIRRSGGTGPRGRGSAPLRSFRPWASGAMRVSARPAGRDGAVLAGPVRRGAGRDGGRGRGAASCPAPKPGSKPIEGSAADGCTSGRVRGDADHPGESRVVLVATGLGGSCLPAGSGNPADSSRCAGRESGPVASCPTARPGLSTAGTIHMAVGDTAGYASGWSVSRDGSLHIAGMPSSRGRWARGRRARRAWLRPSSPGGGLPCRSRASRPCDGRARPGLTSRTHPTARRCPTVPPRGRRRIRRAVHRRGDRLGPGVGPMRSPPWHLHCRIRRWEPRLASEWEIGYDRVVRRRQALCRAARPPYCALPWLARGDLRGHRARVPGWNSRYRGAIDRLLECPTPSFVEAS